MADGIRRIFPLLAAALAVGAAAPVHADPTGQSGSPQDIHLYWHAGGDHDLGSAWVKPADSYCAKNVTYAGFTVDDGGGSPVAKCSYHKTWVNYKIVGWFPTEVAVHLEEYSLGVTPYAWTVQCSDNHKCRTQNSDAGFGTSVFID